MGAQPTRGAHEVDFGDDPMTLRQDPPRADAPPRDHDAPAGPTIFRPQPRRGDPFGPVGVTVPELVPPTVRDPSLTNPPSAGGIRWWVPALLLVILGVAGASGWMVYRGARGEQSRDDDDPPRPVAKHDVGAPPTPVDSQSPFPDFDAPPRPSNAPPPPPGEEHSPCQTAMVAALSSKCDLARRALARCPDQSQHRASAVRAVEALCGLQ